MSRSTGLVRHTPSRSEEDVLDHAGFAVSDYRSSKAFYEKALAPLGIALIAEPSGQAAGFGTEELAFFWLEAEGQPVRGRLHFAFRADDPESVDRFYAAALEAGGTHRPE
jgi:catechol 2,3-dioxygenase-like lactoylglutathione lyase family enzyme